MIMINEEDLLQLNKYFEYEATNKTVKSVVEELYLILDKSCDYEIAIYQDIDNENYYRLYAGCSAVEVFLENDIIQIDFDNGWTLNKPVPQIYKTSLKA